MKREDLVVAVYVDHTLAETAVKKLTDAGFKIKDISVVGKGHHIDEKTAGFYSTGDRVEFWGARGAFWGALWGLFSGGLLLFVPVVGHVVILGHLAMLAAAAIESGALVGGISALGAGLLYYLGIPADSTSHYETAVEGGGFLVMVHGDAKSAARAKDVLQTTKFSDLDLHEDVKVKGK